MKKVTTIELESIRSAKYDNNIDIYGDHSDTCFLCGKPTAQKLWVHYTTDGELTSDDNHPDSQGLFPIGSECAKKLPKSFIK